MARNGTFSGSVYPVAFPKSAFHKYKTVCKNRTRLPIKLTLRRLIYLIIICACFALLTSIVKGKLSGIKSNQIVEPAKSGGAREGVKVIHAGLDPQVLEQPSMETHLHEQNEIHQFHFTKRSKRKKTKEHNMDQPIPLPLDVDVDVSDDWYYGYNNKVSRSRGYRQQLPDGRHSRCKKLKYAGFSSTVSVVIAVYNEAWTVLLRTILSILNRTPARLLHEILVLDDKTDDVLYHTYMKDALPKFFKNYSNVKFFRNEKRKGLIETRQLGWTKSEGDVIVFLDSHVEVNQGWLEPLLERIEKNRQIVAVPVLDKIASDSFVYTPSPTQPSRNTFTWDLHVFDEGSRVGTNGHLPLQTPVTIHGQFAISKRFLERLGGFDTGLQIYGGENLEISFKAWMCGGRVEVIPCSRVGHVEREIPYLDAGTKSQHLNRNLLRVAMVWMDDHSTFYRRSTKALYKLDPGDLKERFELKNDLKCKSFDWYLKNVYPDIVNPKGTVIADSDIRSLALDGNSCLDSSGGDSEQVIVYPCHSTGGNQRWWYTIRGEIRRYHSCVEYTGKKLITMLCNKKRKQFWLYIPETKTMRHVESNKCLTVTSSSSVEVKPCEDHDESQTWVMDNFNMTLYEKSKFKSYKYT